MFRVVDLGLYLLEHGEVLDEFFGECVYGLAEVCERGDESWCRVWGRWCLFHGAHARESACEGAGIVICRTGHAGTPLSSGLTAVGACSSS